MILSVLWSTVEVYETRNPSPCIFFSFFAGGGRREDRESRAQEVEVGMGGGGGAFSSDFCSRGTEFNARG